ncbi:divergent polysaccharide deacetylase family protein [Pararhodobacter oceanensis]|uniref:Divergent polysaccharide deacetylase family protein n=1 Tax=Pararhodobacter oceanensis TaxID=2172121 RepID=A0A2T8HW62_9RHOB|nr:divergent polysaccharide deacetylase family protein [Pararhodobacter oceanensis]PVH29677.1 hypothetical protein DDE20_06065 [Pararhodobacter oceanensis]
MGGFIKGVLVGAVSFVLGLAVLTLVFPVPGQLEDDAGPLGAQVDGAAGEEAVAEGEPEPTEAPEDAGEAAPEAAMEAAPEGLAEAAPDAMTGEDIDAEVGGETDATAEIVAPEDASEGAETSESEVMGAEAEGAAETGAALAVPQPEAPLGADAEAPEAGEGGGESQAQTVENAEVSDAGGAADVTEDADEAAPSTERAETAMVEALEEVMASEDAASVTEAPGQDSPAARSALEVEAGDELAAVGAGEHAAVAAELPDPPEMPAQVDVTEPPVELAPALPEVAEGETPPEGENMAVGATGEEESDPLIAPELAEEDRGVAQVAELEGEAVESLDAAVTEALPVEPDAAEVDAGVAPVAEAEEGAVESLDGAVTETLPVEMEAAGSDAGVAPVAESEGHAVESLDGAVTGALPVEIEAPEADASDTGDAPVVEALPVETGAAEGDAADTEVAEPQDAAVIEALPSGADAVEQDTVGAAETVVAGSAAGDEPQAAGEGAPVQALPDEAVQPLEPSLDPTVEPPVESALETPPMPQVRRMPGGSADVAVRRGLSGGTAGGSVAGSAGAEAPTAGVRIGRLPSIGRSTESDLADAADAQATEAADAITPSETTDLPAYQRYAAEVSLAPGANALGVVLIEDPMAEAALTALPLPVTLAMDPADPDGPRRAAAYRAAGHEIALLAQGIPEGATPADIEVTLQVWMRDFPQVVALIDVAEGGIASRRLIARDLALMLAPEGYGVIALRSNLDAFGQAAQAAGLATASVYRRVDGAGQSAIRIRRMIDRAGFEAQRSAGILIVGSAGNPDTLEALRNFAQASARGVVVTPASAVLAVQ